MRWPMTFVLIFLVGAPLFSLSSSPVAPDAAALDEAVAWVQAPRRSRAEFDYVMTARIRLLFFWIGKDDVGGGYIRLGTGAENASDETIDVLFGSDPAKAPRGINRWGAATEVLRSGAEDRVTSAFFGFMKSSKGASVREMESELAAEQSHGRHRFEAIVSRVDRERAISRVVPFYSDQDFDMHQFQLAQDMVMTRLGEPGRLRHLDGPSQMACIGERGFLFTVQQMIEAALSGRKAPLSSCYLYNARHYGTTLKSLAPVAEKTVRVKLRDQAQEVEATYRDLLDAEFEIVNYESGERSSFELFVAGSGPLRGVPVQIVHQPNWWFKVVLNLRPAADGVAALHVPSPLGRR